MTYDGSTLTLSPWAAQALTDDDIHVIAKRAVAQKCRLVVGKSQHDQVWSIRISSWAVRDGVPVTYIERRPYAGKNLGRCISEALDEYAAADRYTPDELVSIAAASGVAVSRA